MPTKEGQEEGREKDISKMIRIVPGEITEFVKRRHIDAIVNAANPTLMGSTQPGVDKAIHDAVDSLCEEGETFNKLILKGLGESEDESRRNVIRCRRGEAAVTDGGRLCRHVIHVVGPKYDGKQNTGGGIKGAAKKAFCSCTGSCIQKLESCYFEIIQKVKENQCIATVAIPVISSGNYGFPFETAVRVALSSIGNALMEWKDSDTELFNECSLETVYLCIYHSNARQQDQWYRQAYDIWEDDYKAVLQKDEKTVCQNTWQAHIRYIKEIREYDHSRGYFAVAKGLRLFLMYIRTFFLLPMLLKDIFGKYNWHKRRRAVEYIVFGKLLMTVLLGFICTESGSEITRHLCGWLLIYFMADTVTYLLALIVLSDIQRPSANVIRSMLFLFLNYLEVSGEMAVIYFVFTRGGKEIGKAMQFGFMPSSLSDVDWNTIGKIELALRYLNSGIKFFFITLAFGYFTSQLHPRKYRS